MDKLNTLPKLLKANYEKFGDRKLSMSVKDLGIWQPYTWKDYYEKVKYFSLGLISLGLESGDNVAILGETKPESYWAELAVQACQGAAVGIFTDCMPEEVKYFVSHSDSKFVVVHDQEQADKLLKIKDDLPLLKKVIYWDPGYGGKVVGTIAIARHAIRAAELGCDAVVVTGQEAAAHGANATSMVLIPIVSSQVKIPVIAAGGFCNGGGLAAALALGADGISMGSRFMLTKESRVHDNFKRLCLQATEQDTLYSDRFDGMPGRVLKTEVAEAMTKGGFPFIEAFKGASEVKRLLGLPFGQFISLSFHMMRADEGSPLWVQARQAAGARRHMMAIYEGDEKEGILFAGECCGGINDLPSVKEVIDRVIAEAEEALKAARKRIV